MNRLKPTMKYSFSPILLSAAVAAALLSGCGKPADPATGTAPAAKPALTVSLVPAKSSVKAQRLSVSGNVMPWQEAVVGLEVGGQRITRVLVNVGDQVRKGQVLATLNTESLSAELLSASASLAEARATLAQAEVTRDRAKRLAPVGGVSEQELSQHETALQTAQARVQAAQAQETATRQRLGYATLRAPDDGIISSRTAAEGAIAQAGTEMFKLIRRSALEWRAEVPADQLHMVKQGATAVVKHPDGSEVQGTVRQISPSVDLATRNGLVYVDLPKGVALRAGMHVAGALLGAEVPVITLPLSAVLSRDGKSYVFTVPTAKTGYSQVNSGLSTGAGPASDRVQVRQQAVALGQSDSKSVEVLSGLAEGDQVVGQGAGFLKDGDSVSVVPAAEVK